MKVALKSLSTWCCGVFFCFSYVLLYLIFSFKCCVHYLFSVLVSISNNEYVINLDCGSCLVFISAGEMRLSVCIGFVWRVFGSGALQGQLLCREESARSFPPAWWSQCQLAPKQAAGQGCRASDITDLRMRSEKREE